MTGSIRLRRAPVNLAGHAPWLALAAGLAAAAAQLLLPGISLAGGFGEPGVVSSHADLLVIGAAVVGLVAAGQLRPALIGGMLRSVVQRARQWVTQPAGTWAQRARRTLVFGALLGATLFAITPSLFESSLVAPIMHLSEAVLSPFMWLLNLTSIGAGLGKAVVGSWAYPVVGIGLTTGLVELAGQIALSTTRYGRSYLVSKERALEALLREQITAEDLKTFYGVDDINTIHVTVLRRLLRELYLARLFKSEQQAEHAFGKEAVKQHRLLARLSRSEEHTSELQSQR